MLLNLKITVQYFKLNEFKQDSKELYNANLKLTFYVQYRNIETMKKEHYNNLFNNDIYKHETVQRHY